MLCVIQADIFNATLGFFKKGWRKIAMPMPLAAFLMDVSQVLKCIPLAWNFLLYKWEREADLKGNSLSFLSF